MDTRPAGCAARKKPDAARYIMEKQSTAMTTDIMFSYFSHFYCPPKKKADASENWTSLRHGDIEPTLKELPVITT